MYTVLSYNHRLQIQPTKHFRVTANSINMPQQHMPTRQDDEDPYSLDKNIKLWQQNGGKQCCTTSCTINMIIHHHRYSWAVYNHWSGLVDWTSGLD